MNPRRNFKLKSRRQGLRRLGRADVKRRLSVEHLDQRRVLAAITGAVFHDADHSFRQEAGEMSLPNRVVYIDVNDNGAIDRGEQYAIADESGQFLFENVGDGNYPIRLFNGTQTQRQIFPVEATIPAASIDIANAIDFAFGSDSTSVVLTADAVEVVNFESASTQSVSVGSPLTKMQSLPDGTVLVIGGDSAWVVDPTTQTVTSVDLSQSTTPVVWSDVAIDANGRGILVEANDESAELRSIDSYDATAGFVVSTTSTSVPSDTVVLASATGPRSVLAWAGNDGLKLSLWSNETASMITAAPIEISGASDLLDFDDASGLLLLREDSGGVSVLDVNADFASLHSFPDATGPVALDGARDLLLTVSPVGEVLRLIDLRNGELIADLAVDLSSIGQVSSLATRDKPDSVTLLGSAGIIEISLKRPDAHRVKVEQNQDVQSILFAVAIDGSENTTPTYDSMPVLTVLEDATLTRSAPGALDGVVDADGDQVILLQQSEAANGDAEIAVDGSVIYTPDPDFNGDEPITVILTDGVNISDPIDIDIWVTPVPDPPSEIVPDVEAVPENIDVGQVIGDIFVIDVDGLDQHEIQIEDPRFIVQDGVIIFIGSSGGQGLDFESEPVIQLTITATDTETGDIIEEHVTLTVQDVNEPITAITPTDAWVHENSAGESITQLVVHDEDTQQAHRLEVDDDRFVVDGDELRLADGVSLDFEEEAEIDLNVTATEVDTGNSYTEKIKVHVIDVPEQPTTLELSGNSVMELEAGAIVGDVTVDGKSVSGRYDLSVDDSRFEIAGSTLKLLDDQLVKRSTQSEIEVTITAEDSEGVFTALSETFILTVLENETPFHNDDNPFDVNNIGGVTAADALMIINYLNEFGPGPVGHGDPLYGYDVNGDGYITAIDALLILNELNRQSIGTVAGEKEDTRADGEQIVENQPSDQMTDRNRDQLTDPTPDPDPIPPSPNKSKGTFAAVPQMGTQNRSVATESLGERVGSDSAAEIDEAIRLLTHRV
ncbi:dockerin type I domain-containing protein [Novipirellula artificiosorum]|uniref:Cadherin-like domain-containing protein n=1 Tax=Novipirellula artificiosorum TaxID=2528016 RepID=A0A5C6E0M6_9BACT|nr:dockerin type I domain-containing protein [Novipirellula artificiosorum]TWU42410.1 hypothetical protein Poly41_07070 [Novipirellula artificiosorum]